MKITVHPLFFLFGLYFALTGKVFLFLNFTLTALFHELGHAVAMERLGYKINKLSLMPYGTVINGAIEGLSYKDEIKVAFYGPLFNLCVCVIFTCLWWLVPNWYPYLESVVFSNLCVFAINLLPAYPLDGGRILSATLSLYISRKKSMLITKIIGLIICALLLALFVYSVIISNTNISILFFALFIGVGSVQKSKENAYVKTFFGRALSSKSVKECKHLLVSDQVTLKQLIAMTESDCFFTLEITNPSTQRTTRLNYKQSEILLSSYRLYDKIGDILQDLKNCNFCQNN